MTGRSLGENVLLMLEVRGEWRAASTRLECKSNSNNNLLKARYEFTTH